MKQIYSKTVPSDIHALLSSKGAYDEFDDYTYSYAFDWCMNKGTYIYIQPLTSPAGSIFHPHLYGKAPALHISCTSWEMAADSAIKHVISYL